MEKKTFAIKLDQKFIEEITLVAFALGKKKTTFAREILESAKKTKFEYEGEKRTYRDLLEIGRSAAQESGTLDEILQPKSRGVESDGDQKDNEDLYSMVREIKDKAQLAERLAKRGGVTDGTQRQDVSSVSSLASDQRD